MQFSFNFELQLCDALLQRDQRVLVCAIELTCMLRLQREISVDEVVLAKLQVELLFALNDLLLNHFHVNAVAEAGLLKS